VQVCRHGQNGTWALLNANQEKILALTSKVAKIHRAMKKPANKKEDKKADNNRNANANNNNRQQNRIPCPICKEDKWCYMLPDKDAPCTKNKSNKKYYWCPHHANGKGMWTLHSPDNCCNKKGKNTGQNKKATATTMDLKPKVYFNATNATFEEGSNEE